MYTQVHGDSSFITGVTISTDQGKYAAALDELRMAEEAFDLCDPSVQQGIDNIALLMLDVVWCDLWHKPCSAPYMSLAGASTSWVTCARCLTLRLGCDAQGLDLNAATAPAWSDCARCMAASSPSLPRTQRWLSLCTWACMKLARGRFVRLEVLEGVAAYHSGDVERARASLRLAKDKYAELQVGAQHSMRSLHGRPAISQSLCIPTHVLICVGRQPVGHPDIIGLRRRPGSAARNGLFAARVHPRAALQRGRRASSGGLCSRGSAAGRGQTHAGQGAAAQAQATDAPGEDSGGALCQPRVA